MLVQSKQHVMEIDTSAENWLEEVMDIFGDRLTNLAYSYTKDWGKAQEIVQDVFFTCYKKQETVRGIEHFKAWVYQVTINRCRDVHRSAWVKRVKVGSPLFVLLKDAEPTPESSSLLKDRRKRLAVKIMELPLKYREVIHLYYYEELDVKEVAGLLGQKENTVKTRLKRGREALGAVLERGDFDAD